MRVPGVQLDRLPMRERMPLLERTPGIPMPDGPSTFKFEQGPEGSFRVFTDGFASASGLKLAELNPDLGEYFGTREGVLVLEAPKDSSSALRAGDVILSIDGRAVKTDEQAQRIFRSYADGETAKLEVMRKQRKLTVTWKASEREEGRTFWRTPRPTRERTRVERS
ncbi:MAG: PDZ domain-containing protein [Gemmatimonadetes bacterium]|nr:PDZ domain-containing protein [Gemmatimonadota bacterium]